MPHLPDHPPPPPPPAIEAQQEMFVPVRPFRFYPVDLGLAFGMAAAVFMLLAMLIAVAKGNPASMNFFEDIFPGFNLKTVGGIFLGLVGSFVAAFILGFLTGLLYNWRVRRRVTD
ncbi:MAG: hypothetical protein ONB44_15870 [candidate division KSB1 bacterium]|nr:hypothetical protein [candidate division KSB1 bacterium]MDZ7303610.1 hypothetical protein [candidate division KSB1 bacterium]MDZ7312847.1 hypothetical protein [candidate division KSB1 bacterium]